MFAFSKKYAGIIALLTASCMVLSGCKLNESTDKKQTLTAVVGQNTIQSSDESQTQTTDEITSDTTTESQSSTESKTTTSSNTTSSSKKTTSSSEKTTSTTKKKTTTTSKTTSKTQSTTTTKPKKTTTTKTEAPEIEHQPTIVDSVNAQLIISQIPQKDRAIFNKINRGINNFSETINFSYGEATQKQVENALMIISLTNLEDNYVSPEYTISVDSRGNVTKLVLTFTKTYQQHLDELEQLEKVIDEIVAGCTADNDYDAVKYFHDEIIMGCKYDATAENMLSAYGCLVDGRAVCEGYAKALILLCTEYGIECMPITGNTINSEGVVEPHMWNLVKLDGLWYHFDLTWDDPITDLGEDFIKYDYFAIGESVISTDHQITPIVYVTYPISENYDNDYFTKYGLKFDDVDVAISEFERVIGEAVLKQERFVSIKLSDAETFSSFKTRVFDAKDKEIFNILSKVKENTGSELFNHHRCGKIFSEDKNIVIVVLNYE